MKILVLCKELDNSRFIEDITDMSFREFILKYPTVRIINRCNEKGLPFSSHDLSRFDVRDNIIDIFCKGCPLCPNCTQADRNNIEDCELRDYALLFCEAPNSLEDLHSLWDTSFVWFVIKGQEETNALLGKEVK